MLAITVDFGGTQIKIGIIQNGKVIVFNSIPAHSKQGLGPRLEIVEKEIKKLIHENNLNLDKFSGIGIAIPGIVNFDNQTVIAINAKYNDAKQINFNKWGWKAFQLPVVLENDAKAALMGEVTYGCAAGAKDAVLMTFGTGIGTAAYINGSMLRGKHHQAGCLGGHITNNYKGRRCSCGNIGCLEAHSSNSVLHEIAKSYEGFSTSLLLQHERIDYKAIIEFSQLNDKISKSILDDLIQCWGAGITNLIHAYDPEVVILSGGLMKSSDYILPLLEKYVEENAWTPWGNVVFGVAENPEISVLLGLYVLLRLPEERSLVNG